MTDAIQPGKSIQPPPAAMIIIGAQADAIGAAALACRSGCGACCIAISISSPIPGMPEGKAAGVPCVQLTEDFRCAIFGEPDRPQVCASLRPTADMCGATREEALSYLAGLEIATAPRG